MNVPISESEKPIAVKAGGGFFSGEKMGWMLPSLVLFLLVFIAYLPMIAGQFIMDDQRLVESDNPLVNGEFTPFNIWFQTDFTLSTFGFWLERVVWGTHPMGYHVVNLVLHGLSAVLLWQLLRRLKIPGAWLAGALFAVHPVCVNSVARIAELKNTLSLPFFLLSFWAYLHYENVALYGQKSKDDKHKSLSSPWPAVGWYQLSFLFCLLALLAKTSTVMLPLLLLAVAAWQRRRLTLKDVWPTLPFFVLAGAFGIMSIWFQTHQALADAGETLAPASMTTRLATAGHVFWFYLGKALLPVRLNLVYPAWKTEGALAQWLPSILAVVSLVVCWIFRRSWGRHGLMLLGGFAIALFPVLGLFDSQFLTRWQVSDHLQYLPLIIPVAFAAAIITRWLPAKILPVASVVLVAVLLVLTFQRAQAFATEENLMRDTLAKNPAAASAHNDMGTIFARRQDYPAALQEFKTALKYRADDPDIRLNLGQLLALQGQLDAAEQQYLAGLKLRHNEPLMHEQYAHVLLQENRIPEAILQLEASLIFQKQNRPDTDIRLQLAALFYQTDHFHRAAGQLRLAVAGETNSVDALNNLAWILATCPDPQVRNGTEAIADAVRACELTHYQSATPISTLAAAYAEAGRFSEAVSTVNNALKIENATGDFQHAAINQQLLAGYQAGQPFHENLPADLDP